jgi:hypothetical protein
MPKSPRLTALVRALEAVASAFADARTGMHHNCGTKSHLCLPKSAVAALVGEIFRARPCCLESMKRGGYLDLIACETHKVTK